MRRCLLASVKLVLVVLLAISTGLASFALCPADLAWARPTHGVWLIQAHPYYAHPVTGIIEDRGQNPGIGQGMSESVLGKQALIEVDSEGAIYATVRFALMDNIQDVKIATQSGEAAEFETVAHTVSREDMDNGTADIRFQLSSDRDVVRAELFVIPMGRDVVFFMNFREPVAVVASDGGYPTDVTEGFVVSIQVDQSLALREAQEAALNPEPLLEDAPVPATDPLAYSAAANSFQLGNGLTLFYADGSSEILGGGEANAFADFAAGLSLEVYLLIGAALLAVALIVVLGVVWYRGQLRRRGLR